MGAATYELRAGGWRCAIAAAAIAACSAGAGAATAPVIAAGEPAGFAALIRESEVMVDIYFGGTRRGEAMIRLTPDTVTVLDPAALLAILPPLTDAAAVRAAFGKSLAPNSEHACSPGSDPALCGRLAPDDVGVILARDRFRLDVFLNPRFIATADRIEEPYLPAPHRGLSLVNAVAAFVSGQSEGAETYVTLSNQLVLARGEQRLRADASLERSALALNRLVLEWDRPERRYSAGMFVSPGSGLDSGMRLLGAGIETQIDTRRDRERLLGSPVVVFLDRRARVDTIYDGRVVGSRMYEAGNQPIDTETLPEGAYEILLRIEEVGGASREERRFYSKNRRVPSLGRVDFYLFGGYDLGDAGRRGASGNGEFAVQGGYSRRLTERLALDASLAAREGYQSVEAGASLITPSLYGRAAVIAASDGRLGSALRVSSTGTGTVNYSFDLRTVSAGNPAPGAPAASDERRSGYTQAGGLVSLSRGDFRVLGTFYVRDEANAPTRYGIGPTIEWDAARFGAAVLTLRSDISATEAGASGFVGVALRFAGREGTVSSLAGYRHSRIADDDQDNGAAGALSAALTRDVLGGEASLGAGYEFAPSETNAIGSLEFDHRSASLSADIVRAWREGNGATTQYTVGLQTLMLAGPGVPVTLAGKSTTTSGVVVEAVGARPGDRFEVLVDEHVTGHLEGARPLFIRLPDYQVYSVRIRPTGAGLVAYDGAPREIGLFPGSVGRLAWEVAPVAIRYGRLVDAQGEPVGDATILGKGVWTQTDATGRFQLEAPDALALEVVTASGERFQLNLPGASGIAEQVAHIGTIECCNGTAPRARYTVAAALERKDD